MGICAPSAEPESWHRGVLAAQLNHEMPFRKAARLHGGGKHGWLGRRGRAGGAAGLRLGRPARWEPTSSPTGFSRQQILGRGGWQIPTCSQRRSYGGGSSASRRAAVGTRERHEGPDPAPLSPRQHGAPRKPARRSRPKPTPSGSFTAGSRGDLLGKAHRLRLSSPLLRGLVTGSLQRNRHRNTRFLCF